MSDSAISVISLMAPVGSFSLRRTLPRIVGVKDVRKIGGSAALERTRGVQSPQQFLKPRLDHGAFCVGVGTEFLDSAADLGFELRHTAVERREALVALALERLRGLREARLETLRARVPDMRESLGEHALGFSREHFDGAVELTR